MKFRYFEFRTIRDGGFFTSDFFFLIFFFIYLLDCDSGVGLYDFWMRDHRNINRDFVWLLLEKASKTFCRL